MDQTYLEGVIGMADSAESKETEQKAAQANGGNRAKAISAAVGFVLIVAVGAAVYFWQDARDARSQTPDAIAERNQEESDAVIQSLGAILQLDGEEEPTVARIEDPDVLREANPEFYADAQLNDYLILYPQQAIIFRESENKIIKTAPIINTADLQPQTDSDQNEDSGDES